MSINPSSASFRAAQAPEPPTNGTTVVIIAFHAPNQLDRCLRVLGGEIRALVVDNSSDPDVARVCLENHARYHDAGANLGFGRGVNLALSLLDESRDDILLLNPDAELTAEQCRRLLTVARGSAEDVAVVAPGQTYPSGAEQRVRWPWPSPSGAWVEALGFGRLRTGLNHGFLIGSVLLLRRQALDQVGLMDPRFFLYAEEVDWQRRAAALGWKSFLEPSVRAVHIGAGTSTDSLRRDVLFHAAQETYIRKWFGRRGWWSYRAAVLVGCSLRVLPRRTRAAARRRLTLYVQGPCRVASEQGLLP